MRRRLPKRPVLVTLIVLGLVAIGGAASAYWSAGGGGEGAGGTGHAVDAITLTPGTPVGDLYPGSSANVVLTMTNPNEAAVRIESLALDATRGSNGFGVDGAHVACGLTALTFATQNNGASGWIVAKNVDGSDGSLQVTLPDALSMSVDAAAACQGADFTVYLTAVP